MPNSSYRKHCVYVLEGSFNKYLERGLSSPLSTLTSSSPQVQVSADTKAQELYELLLKKRGK